MRSLLTQCSQKRVVVSPEVPLFWVTAVLTASASLQYVSLSQLHVMQDHLARLQPFTPVPLAQGIHAFASSPSLKAVLCRPVHSNRLQGSGQDRTDPDRGYTLIVLQNGKLPGFGLNAAPQTIWLTYYYIAPIETAISQSFDYELGRTS